MNRKAIKKALTEYKEAVKQQSDILKDGEIQGLFELELDGKARSLILERYPNGVWNVVNSRRINLIEIMIKDIPSWKGITAEDVLCAESSVFDDLIKLAEEV